VGIGMGRGGSSIGTGSSGSGTPGGPPGGTGGSDNEFIYKESMYGPTSQDKLLSNTATTTHRPEGMPGFAVGDHTGLYESRTWP
jgi:hypothetical protein